MLALRNLDLNTLITEIKPVVSIQDQQDYPEFANNMAKWGYTWDAHKVQTDDGFVLTTFHVTGKIGEQIETDKDRAPVLLMHG